MLVNVIVKKKIFVSTSIISITLSTGNLEDIFYLIAAYLTKLAVGDSKSTAHNVERQHEQ
jgi:hypothetical protein